MSFFERHLFICTNARHDACAQSCNDNGEADAALAFLKSRCNQLGLAGPGKLRISKAGCLGRCKSGPLMVIYPEARWYRYQNENDLNDILLHELQNRQAVERLLLD
ncbi:(2Fe-2S) ferredoxin domain-containing protein [Neisseria leonii]|uniref:(2Fe-2S) ferredoxin domain-containing protein n=1 Tax=Neisseria leonii TaxID=2995413 RepID=A0A9X4E8T5_9NEIS|nr:MULTISPECIES: (2Fe-2S) ferredoxin domain-containing protein [unclassified Neisseria]MDD9324786.1 (2Fe-2S) ferredoxin domain-containing protein [Neisseria sp. 3986]MDD9327653.1 (2Fe-2S) ferredoxin domain-containing protein [Neisseria sp. 51.81]